MINKKQFYCKRCGGFCKVHFQIQLSPKKYIGVCTFCFEWARNKTIKEIKEDCKLRKKSI